MVMAAVVPVPGALSSESSPPLEHHGERSKALRSRAPVCLTPGIALDTFALTARCRVLAHVDLKTRYLREMRVDEAPTGGQ